METMTVWTKQNKNILQTLEDTGRHIAKREYIIGKMGEEISTLYLDVYTWYAGKASAIVPKPEDVKYPIWVALAEESKLRNDPGTVVLELEIDKSLLMYVDYDKWGHIVNYMYIPKDREDLLEHNKLLSDYGVDDPHAYMSGFYPMIKKKIIKSWDRLFDMNGMDPNAPKMGTIWEIKREWVKHVIQ